MALKHRVEYYESEQSENWSGTDCWTTDYNSYEEAMEWVKKTNDKYCSSSQTPDYYIKAKYLGEFTV